jgi:hypothetical protein
VDALLKGPGLSHGFMEALNDTFLSCRLDVTRAVAQVAALGGIC